MKIGTLGFVCPHCGTKSQHSWSQKQIIFNGVWSDIKFQISRCGVCNSDSIWDITNGTQVYPNRSNDLPLPNKDMDDSIIQDFNEAATIFNLSPRGACALLRLSLQKLLKQLGESGDNIAKDLKSLETKQILPKTILQAIDVTRYFGNESVHPGELNMNDTPELAKILFTLINKIAEYGISGPKELSALHEIIPEEKRQV